VREPEGPGIRVDSGVYTGWDVPPFYDSMLAKLIVWAPDRETACARLSQALRDSVYLGIDTNVDFLRRIVDDTAFRHARLRTDMLKLRPELADGPKTGPEDLALAAAVLCQAVAPRNGASNGAPAARGAGSTAVWHELAGFRLFEGKP
jgi:acetyl/propionyl-CoA carboxylase alpha subunit